MGVAPRSPIYRTDWTPEVAQKVLAAALVGGGRLMDFPLETSPLRLGSIWVGPLRTRPYRTGPDPTLHPYTGLITRARLASLGSYLVLWCYSLDELNGRFSASFLTTTPTYEPFKVQKTPILAHLRLILPLWGLEKHVFKRQTTAF